MKNNPQIQSSLFTDKNTQRPSKPIISHNHLVEIEEMALEESKSKNLIINYSFKESMWGEILIASTEKGIVYLGFSADSKTELSNLKKRFPNVQLIQ